MALDATVGGANSNSYCTVGYADAYHVLRGFNAEWTAALTPAKEAALVWATRLLERLSWRGYKTTPAQALRWPRANAFDQDQRIILNSIIPLEVGNATAELALYLLREDRTLDSGAIGINALTVGPISLDFDRNAPTKAVPDGVKAIIAFLLESTGNSARLVRV